MEWFKQPGFEKLTEVSFFSDDECAYGLICSEKSCTLNGLTGSVCM